MLLSLPATGWSWLAGVVERHSTCSIYHRYASNTRDIEDRRVSVKQQIRFASMTDGWEALIRQHAPEWLDNHAIPRLSNQCPIPVCTPEQNPLILLLAEASFSQPNPPNSQKRQTRRTKRKKQPQTVPLMLSSRISCSTCSTRVSRWPWAYCSRVSASRYCWTWAMRL